MALSINEDALRHSVHCRALLDDERLMEIWAYCKAQRIEPPSRPPGAGDGYANCLCAIAEATLADFGWWAKRLKLRAARDAGPQRHSP